MTKIAYFSKNLIKILCLPIYLASTPSFADIPEASLQFFPPMNVIYHPVSTTSKDAQKHFDRGLSYVYAYNHDEAFRDFEKASQIDPNLAMAYWGMAVALGQNVNTDVSPENEIKAYNYVQQAIKLAPSASPWEQKYISALSDRYVNDPKADFVPLRSKYRNALKKVVEAYPEDLDAATLYAESILMLNPWKWWTPEGKPEPGVMEAINVLEFVLMRDPQHIGANHFYIHAWEESPTPERALMSAHRLQYLFPESGHLVHMGNHIFIPVGDYEDALKASLRSIALDQEYVKKYGMDAGPYPLHYLSHNMKILTRVYMLMEDYDNAIKNAFAGVEFAEPYFEETPHSASIANTPLEVYLYFGKWKELLEYPLKNKTPSGEAFWHYSRAVAYAMLNDMESAQKEKELMEQSQKKIASHEEIANNPASKVLELAAVMLDATFANVKNDNDAYIKHLKKGVELQEALWYDEPPAWYIPVREVLGFAYLEQKQYVEAEKAFRTILTKLDRNGRILFGLSQSLKGQDRPIDAYWVEREMKAALKRPSNERKNDG